MKSPESGARAQGLGFHCFIFAGLLLWGPFGFSSLPPHLSPALFLTPSNLPIKLP